VTIMDNNPKREVAHDETPSPVTGHAFVPREQWWSLCKICGFAEAAHEETTLTGDEHRHGRVPIHYYSDDNPDDE